MDIRKLAERFAEEKEAHEKFSSEMQQKAKRDAENWIETAPLRAIEQVASLPRRKFDYCGRPLDGAWTNEDLRELLNIGLEGIRYEVTIKESRFGADAANVYFCGFAGHVSKVWTDVKKIWAEVEAEIRA